MRICSGKWGMRNRLCGKRLLAGVQPTYGIAASACKLYRFAKNDPKRVKEIRSAAASNAMADPNHLKGSEGSIAAE